MKKFLKEFEEKYKAHEEKSQEKSWHTCGGIPGETSG